MILEPTCLILGAGASAPYKLPTASQLRDLILTSRTPNGPATADQMPIQAQFQQTVMGVRTASNDWVIYLNDVTAAAELAHLIPEFWNRFAKTDQNIDWFLQRNEEEFGDIARLQMATVLLNCERGTNLLGNWYQQLSRVLFSAGLEGFPPGNLSVISFNYDRSFERYFLNVLESNYDPSFTEAQERWEKLPLLHVYGQLGSLTSVPYGDATKAEIAATGIRLMRPQADDAVQEKIARFLGQATYINFVGFGFDADNVNLLGPKNFAGKRVISTSKGLDPVRKRQVISQLGVRFLGGVNGPELDAAQLLQETDLFGPKQPPRGSRPSPVRPSSGRRWVR